MGEALPAGSRNWYGLEVRLVMDRKLIQFVTDKFVVY